MSRRKMTNPVRVQQENQIDLGPDFEASNIEKFHETKIDNCAHGKQKPVAVVSPRIDSLHFGSQNFTELQERGKIRVSASIFRFLFRSTE